MAPYFLEGATPERWQSGRLCSTGNAVSRKRDRGFESPSLRLFLYKTAFDPFFVGPNDQLELKILILC